MYLYKILLRYGRILFVSYLKGHKMYFLKADIVLKEIFQTIELNLKNDWKTKNIVRTL